MIREEVWMGVHPSCLAVQAFYHIRISGNNMNFENNDCELY